MTTWSDFDAAEPDLAQRARAILTSTTNGVLGTLRADGSPRLSGIDPFFVGDELLIGSMEGARKGADLRRDPRCSLHGIPWESRKVKEGGVDAGDADVKLTARAVPIDSPEEQRRIMAAFAAERGFEPPEGGELFRLDVESATLIYVENDRLVIDRWSAGGSRVTVRRS